MRTDFEIKETGLYYQDKFVSDFIPVLRAIDEKRDIVTENSNRTYHIYIMLAGGEKLQEYEFDSIKNISYFQFWPECCDAGLSSEQKRLLSFYIQTQAKQCDRIYINCYSKLGYFPEAYVFSQNMIINLGNDKDVHNEASNDLPIFNEKVPEKLAELKILENIFKVKKGFSEILFLYDILAIAKPLFCKAGCIPNIFLVIFGKSGVGKTLLSNTLFVQHESQKLNFKIAKKTSVEKTIEKFSGHTVLVDDYHPESLSYDKGRQKEILDLISRTSDDIDCGMTVVTAEFRDGFESTQDRMFPMELEEGLDDYEAIQYIRNHKKDYNMLLFYIAKKIYTSSDSVIDLIKRQFKIYSFDACEGRHRVIYGSKLLKICVDLAAEVIFPEEWDRIKEILDEEELEKYLCDLLDQYRDKQLDYMKRFLKYQEGINWIELLYNLIYVDKVFVLCPEEEDIKNPAYRGLAIWSRESRIYIRSATLNKGLEKHFEKKVSCKKLIKVLAEEKILCTDNSTSLMKKVHKQYYYIIDEHRLNETYNLWKS